MIKHGGRISEEAQPVVAIGGRSNAAGHEPSTREPRRQVTPSGSQTAELFSSVALENKRTLGSWIPRLERHFNAGRRS